MSNASGHHGDGAVTSAASRRGRARQISRYGSPVSRAPATAWKGRPPARSPPVRLASGRSRSAGRAAGPASSAQTVPQRRPSCGHEGRPAQRGFLPGRTSHAELVLDSAPRTSVTCMAVNRTPASAATARTGCSREIAHAEQQQLPVEPRLPPDPVDRGEAVRPLLRERVEGAATPARAPHALQHHLKPPFGEHPCAEQGEQWPRLPYGVRIRRWAPRASAAGRYRSASRATPSRHGNGQVAVDVHAGLRAEGRGAGPEQSTACIRSKCIHLIRSSPLTPPRAAGCSAVRRPGRPT